MAPTKTKVWMTKPTKASRPSDLYRNDTGIEPDLQVDIDAITDLLTEKALEDDLECRVKNLAFRWFPYFGIAIAHRGYFVKMIVSIESASSYRAGRAVMMLTWWETGMDIGTTKRKAIDNIGPSHDTKERDRGHKPTTVRQVLSKIIESIAAHGETNFVDLEQDGEQATGTLPVHDSGKATPISTAVAQGSLASWQDVTKNRPWPDKPIKGFREFDKEFERDAESLRMQQATANESEHEAPVVVKDDESGTETEVEISYLDGDIIGSYKGYPINIDDDNNINGRYSQNNSLAAQAHVPANEHYTPPSGPNETAFDDDDATHVDDGTFFDDAFFPQESQSGLRDIDMIIDSY